MFIIEDVNRKKAGIVSEAESAGGKLKSSCEVHGGNLFVQLHFKAVNAVPENYAELINTVVTAKDESKAQFSGCGKHMVAVRSVDEESPLTAKDAYNYIKQYLSIMFGQDIGGSFKEEDITAIDENGETMEAADLKKWEEQQKEGGTEGQDEKEELDEAIPSFSRFMIEDENEAGGEEGEDEAGDEEVLPPATYLIYYAIKAPG